MIKKILTVFSSAVLAGLLVLLPFLLENNQPITVSCEILAPQDMTVGVYYKTPEAGSFDETEAVSALVAGYADKYQTVQLTLPVSRITALRLDFGEHPGYFKIQKIVLSKGILGKNITDTLMESPAHQVNIEVEQDSFLLSSYEVDPYIVIDPLVYGNFTSYILSYGAVLFVIGLFLWFVLHTFLQQSIDFLSRNRQQLAYVPLFAAFLLIIGIPFLTRDTFSPVTEMRAETNKPKLLEENIGFNAEFPYEYEDWFDDHFGGRRWWIDTYAQINYQWLDSLVTEEVLLGKDNWMFYAKEVDGDPVSDYQNYTLYTEQELARIEENLNRIYTLCKENEIEYVFIVAPNKSSVYPEYYPDSVIQVSPYSKLDQLLEHLRANTDIPVLDLRDSLLSDKNSHELYYRTDTHWNNYGAFVGYGQLAEYLSTLYPEIEPLRAEDCTVEEVPLEMNTDLLRLANIKAENYKGPLFDYKITWEASIEAAVLPKAAIYHDSFFNINKDIYLQYFSDIRENASSMDVFYETDQIIEYSPDIVVHEIVERHLDSLLLEENESE